MLQTTHANGYTVTTDDYNYMTQSLNAIASLCHGSAKAAGWDNTVVPTSTKLMLIVSELAEAVEGSPEYNIAIMEIVKCIAKAMEGDRKDVMDEKLPHRKALEVELGDAIIRILHLCSLLDLDIGGAVAEKFHFNQTRPDHKLENRALENGKKY